MHCKITTEIRTKQRGERWEGQVKCDGIWFPCKRGGRVVTYTTEKAAREWAATIARGLIAAEVRVNDARLKFKRA